MLTLLFVVFLLAMVAVRLWLANRQIRHVLSHRAAVPAEFATRITLASHQKAADYTLAKAKVSPCVVGKTTSGKRKPGK